MKAILALLVIFGCNFFVNSKTLPTGDYYLQSVEYGSYWESCRSSCNYIFTEKPFFDNLQRFTFTRLDNGYYTIIVYSGRALAGGLESPNSLSLVDSMNSNAPEQQFKVVYRGGDNYLIKPRLNPSQAIHLPNNYDSLSLKDKDCGSSIQLFKLEPYEGTSRVLSRE